ncbi:MAG TPA: hypothetical protein VKT73_14215 [Xanthobacteraceae bacterium]|nr:hypothetical protein [Xanthobacteraceae bacterium]
MKKILIAGIAVAAFFGAPALAAPPAGSMFDWSGFYFGGDGGYGWGTSKGTGATAALAPNSGPPYDFDANGGFGGGFLGAQKQWASSSLASRRIGKAQA